MSEINSDNLDNSDNPDNSDISKNSDISDNYDNYDNSLVSYSSYNECFIVLFIDNNVKDYQIIVNSCNSNTLPIVYSYLSTKADILNTLSMFTTISRIGICADSNATLFLDNQPFFLNKDLDLDNSMNYSENLTFIISLIKQYDVSYIDYLACNSLNNSNWTNYYQILMSSTNVIVGASNNNTGNIKYGGDWITESNYQDVEFIYFTKNIEYYQYLLGNNFYNKTTDITTNFSSITQLSSFPTFNGISNFSTKFFIKTGATSLDLALLYALNSAPIVASYNTSMYAYVNSTKYDLSSLFAPIPSVSSVTGTYELGDLTSLSSVWPGLSSTYFPSPVKWIWNTNNAHVSAASNVNIQFTYTFNYSGTKNIGTFNIGLKGIGYLIFNGSAPVNINWNSLSTGVTGGFTIVNGTNYIQIICYNPSTSAGVIGSFYDNTNNLVAYTTNAWSNEIGVVINYATSSLAIPIIGGLNTTLYNNNNQYYSTNGALSSSSIYNQSYYYTNIPSLSIFSSKILYNFSKLLYIFDPIPILNWGFKSTGFICPNKTGIWRFSLNADDISQLWIGTTNNTSGISTSISPSSNENLIASYGGGPSATYSYSVTLLSGVYYPILIYYGQATGGENFAFNIYDPSNNIVDIKTVAYYLNYRVKDFHSFYNTNSTTIVPPTPTLNSISNYQLNNYTYYIFGTTTFTVSVNCIAYVLVVGGGGAGQGGNNNNGGGGGGGAIFANINLRAGQTYTATIGASSTITGNNTSLGVTGNTISFTGYGGGKGGISTAGAAGGTAGLNSTDVISPPATPYNGGVGGVVGTGQVGASGTSLTTSTMPTSMYNSTQTFAPLAAFGAGGGGSGNVAGGGPGGSGATGGTGTISGNNGGAGGYGCGGGGARKVTGALGGTGGQGFIYIYIPPQ